MSDSTTRREFLGKTLSLSALAIGGSALLSACGKGGGASAGPCGDLSKLSKADEASRKTSGYVDKSPQQAKLCSGCIHYIGATGGAACGGCKVVKGPIAPGGYCNLWAKKG